MSSFSCTRIVSIRTAKTPPRSYFGFPTMKNEFNGSCATVLGGTFTLETLVWAFAFSSDAACSVETASKTIPESKGAGLPRHHGRPRATGSDRATPTRKGLLRTSPVSEPFRLRRRCRPKTPPASFSATRLHERAHSRRLQMGGTNLLQAPLLLVLAIPVAFPL
jgi:hypothetical protein